LRGKLIVISGIDGSGKSTLLNELKKIYSKNSVFMEGFSSRLFYDSLQKVFQKEVSVFQKEEYDNLLNIAWFCDLLNSTLLYTQTFLKEGKNVFLDRYILCAMVYSLSTTSSNISTLFKIYSFLPKPNLLIYLDIPIEKAMKRIEIRNKKGSYHENPENLEKIQKKYEYFLKKIDYPYIKVSGNKKIDVILKEVQKKIKDILDD